MPASELKLRVKQGSYGYLSSKDRQMEGPMEGVACGAHNLLNLDYVYSEIHHPSHVGTKQW